MNALEREEKNIEDQYDNGEISAAEFHRKMNELRRDYCAAAEESAQEAYDDEISRW